MAKNRNNRNRAMNESTIWALPRLSRIGMRMDFPGRVVYESRRCKGREGMVRSFWQMQQSGPGVVAGWGGCNAIRPDWRLPNFERGGRGGSNFLSRRALPPPHKEANLLYQTWDIRQWTWPALDQDTWADRSCATRKAVRPGR